ncbi:N4-gp56 family major capsid protein [Sagittula salina]|nr:N4-gp56 family major capsid protein [Sagittula salina]
MQTIIPWGDPKAQMKWGSQLAVDTNTAGYFTKKFEGKGDNNIIEQKTELEGDTGDRVSFDLSVQLRGKPTTGDDRVTGKEESLRFYTDQVIIDQTRKSVSAGGKMSRKRTVHDLRKVAKARLAEYWAKYMDELKFIYLSGMRGINEDFIEPEDWTGHAGNAIQPPDAQHVFYPGAVASKATLTAADTMNRDVIEVVSSESKMMRAQDPKTANMKPVTVEGEDHYVVVMSPFQERDMRTAVGATGWLEISKAAAGAEGRASKIFKGGLGMINNVILHCHESVVRARDYGAGSNVHAARALFLGRQAGVIAYGTSGGARFSWFEDKIDGDNEPIVIAGTIVGMKATVFNGKRFGTIAIDTAAKSARAA